MRFLSVLCLLGTLLLPSLVAAAESFAPSGFFAGSAVVSRLVDGVPAPVRRGRAELALTTDGLFRFAAVEEGVPNLCLRGRFRCDARGDGIRFMGEPESEAGILEGEIRGEMALVKFSPQPLVVRHFTLERWAPASPPGEGWPVRSVSPAVTKNPGPGWYHGWLNRSLPPGQRPEVLLFLSPDGSVEGQWRAGGGLSFIAGSWRCGSGTLQLSLKRDSPAGQHLDLRLRGEWDPESGTIAGDLSVDGDIGDGFLLAPSPVFIGGFPERVERVFSWAGGLGAKADGQALTGDAFFPLRWSGDGHWLYVRAPDDPRFWLPFPVVFSTKGDPAINPSGRIGHLTAGASGNVEPFLVRSIPTFHGGKRTISSMGETGLVLPLEIHRGKRSGPDRLLILGSRAD